MSSWQVLQVSVPTYREGSVGRAYVCVCSRVGLDLADVSGLLAALLGLSSATPEAAKAVEKINVKGRSGNTHFRLKNMVFFFRCVRITTPPAKSGLLWAGRVTTSVTPVTWSCDARHTKRLKDQKLSAERRRGNLLILTEVLVIYVPEDKI